MRIALAQLDPTSGDIDGNTQKVLDAIAEATARGAESARHAGDGAFPGTASATSSRTQASSPRTNARSSASPLRQRGLTAVVGFIDSRPLGHATTTARSSSTTPPPSVAGGRVLQRAHKSLLPNYRYFDDKRYFAPARVARAVDVAARRRGATRLGVSICEDMWDEFYAVKPLPELAAKGADVLVNINASPFYPGKRHERDALIRQHIARLRQAVCLRQHRRRRRQRQEHHPVRRREPGLRRATAG